MTLHSWVAILLAMALLLAVAELLHLHYRRVLRNLLSRDQIRRMERDL